MQVCQSSVVNLRLNRSKCRFSGKELKYLGHIIGQGVVKVDPEKVEAIQKMEAPGDKEALRRWLGMITYVSKFCPNLSDRAAPLRELTKDRVPWKWTAEHDETFTRLKELVTNCPCLSTFNPSLPVKLSVDASQFGMGAVVLQNELPVQGVPEVPIRPVQTYIAPVLIMLSSEFFLYKGPTLVVNISPK